MDYTNPQKNYKKSVLIFIIIILNTFNKKILFFKFKDFYTNVLDKFLKKKSPSQIFNKFSLLGTGASLRIINLSGFFSKICKPVI